MGLSILVWSSKVTFPSKYELWYKRQQAHTCISYVRPNTFDINPLPLYHISLYFLAIIFFPLSISFYPYPFIPIPLSLSLYPYSFIPIPLSLFLYPYPIIFKGGGSTKFSENFRDVKIMCIGVWSIMTFLGGYIYFTQILGGSGLRGIRPPQSVFGTFSYPDFSLIQEIVSKDIIKEKKENKYWSKLFYFLLMLYSMLCWPVR